MDIIKMRLTALNPDYNNNTHIWLKLYHAYEGEDSVKGCNDRYLPKTQTMEGNNLYYDNYKTRAVFPEQVYKAVQSYLGCLHRESPTITLPDKISFMEKEATFYGESLEQVLKEINFYQLLYGRVGICVDIRKDSKGLARPYIVLYPPEKVTNWGVTDIEDGNIPSYSFVVIDESGEKLNEAGEWIPVKQYRVLEMLNNVYVNGVFQNESYTPALMKPLSTQSGTFNKIPFVFCNVKDMKPKVQKPPLLGLANLCYAIYRGDADYRQDLHRQSQDTLFTFGIEHPDSGLKIGAGAYVDAPLDARAEYVGVTGVGLEEQRVALETLNAQALHDAGQFMNTPSKQSAEGISLMLNSQMSALHQIATTGAEALKTILKMTCEWMGIKETDKIDVAANTDFVDTEITADDVVKLWTTVQAGGLSTESYFIHLNKKGIISTSPDEEMTKIDDDKEKRLLESDYGDTGNDVVGGSNAVGDNPNENPVS